MNRDLGRPDLSGVLEGLKDFQRETTEYVFRRLYTDADQTDRFLIADEVGLGKTLVARGIIARAIEHLWEEVDRIDIIYVCSNADIARQNINRLNVNVAGQGGVALASRITLLPTVLCGLKQNKVNFVSLTPGTSFDLRSSLGRADERALLYWLLWEAWELRGTGPLNVLRGNASKDSFRALAGSFKKYYSIEPSLAAEFVRALEQPAVSGAGDGKESLRSRFEELSERFHRARKHIPPRDATDRAHLVGELRTLLAATCIEALEPDLVILDEFQRFKHLLTGEDEASQLARKLFQYSDEASRARVLLLSATPYKMYTLDQESSDDDHYEDFVSTLAFLLHEQDGAGGLEQLLKRYRRELYRLGDGTDGAAERLQELKHELETRLRSVMVRTERLAVSDDRNGMLVQIPPQSVRLESRDLQAYVGLQEVAGVLEQGDVLEYWKTAPYLLNFMDDYKLKRALKDAVSTLEGQTGLARVLAAAGGLLFPWSDWRRYKETDPGNPRLRGLLADTVDAGAWRLLWIPPALPYYALRGPFADPCASRLTKRLIFSGWHVVPKAVAALVSYDAERRMMRSFEANPENSPEARKRRPPLLRFARAEGRLTGMPVLGLLYPSTTLAREADPLAIAGQIIAEQDASTARIPTRDDVLKRAERRVKELLTAISADDESSGPEDEHWYWAAPILLDLQFDADSTGEWFSRRELATKWGAGIPERGTEGEESPWAEHVAEARKLVEGGVQLGRQPADLSMVLAQRAIAGPAVAALRALLRVTGSEAQDLQVAQEVRDCAAQVAWAFRNLFNLPVVMALIRGMNREEPYWRRVLEYCVDGCLQATLDEYVHVLRESLGLVGKAPGEVVEEISDAIRSALTLRTSTLLADDVQVDPSGEEVILDRRGMRARFALRFGDERPEEGQEVTRATHVREAFNSPFWPFVLVTTSVGQEGLDFHPYCHAVVHWDLPSNPVDLEQREGRVHRYKGHAVRKNLALKYRGAALAHVVGGQGAPVKVAEDLWEFLFAAAVRDREEGLSDLVPFWLYALEEGARIERHVPTLPLSRDIDRLAALRRSLAVYRMVFGQPRQEDLLAYLLERLPGPDAARILGELRIDLSPPASREEVNSRPDTSSGSNRETGIVETLRRLARKIQGGSA